MENSNFQYFRSKSPSQLSVLILKREKPKIIDICLDLNFSVHWTQSTKQAIKLFQENSYIIVISALGIEKDLSDNYQELLIKVKQKAKSVFFIIYSFTASSDAEIRYECFQKECNMVTSSKKSLSMVLKQISDQFKQKGIFECPLCKMKNLTEDSLWLHMPLYHINSENFQIICSICQQESKPNYQVHLHTFHGPHSRELSSQQFNNRVNFSSFGLVVVRKQQDNSYLLVQEFANCGFWFPGGKVEAGEKITDGAIRECKEEAGIDVNLKGILSIQVSTSRGRVRVIFYAEPADNAQKPKSIPDFESVGASYVQFNQIKKLPLRSKEPLIWIEKIERGAPIYPLDILSK